MENKNKLVVFENKKIKRIWFNEEWWFVAVDLIEILTDSKDPSGYLKICEEEMIPLMKDGGKLPPPF
ncbi:MAG: hypothetical protein ACOC3Z_00150 [Nanoarchaeota archaeon]